MRARLLSVAAAIGLAHLPSHALGLGELKVQSHLGAPLQAEVRVLDITEEEAATLRAAVASPETFRAAGAEYNATLTGVKVSLHRRGDGSHVLRLAGTQPVQDPYMDLIVEASSRSGRVMRDYTLLFEPRPAGRKP